MEILSWISQNQIKSNCKILHIYWRKPPNISLQKGISFKWTSFNLDQRWYNWLWAINSKPFADWRSITNSKPWQFWRTWNKLKKEMEFSSGCNGNVLEKMGTWVFTHLNILTKMELEITQFRGWRRCNSNDERYASITLANGKSFRDVWRFKWCTSCREIEHSIGQNDKTSFKNPFAWSQSRLIIRSHPLTWEGGCYIICNNNVVNIDVVALYLSERLNNNLYYTLEKSIFSVRICIFLSTLFVSQKKNSSNVATREKKANSLVARFFIFMKIVSLVNTYY